MATCGNQSPELENDNRDAFYDIDACPTKNSPTGHGPVSATPVAYWGND